MSPKAEARDAEPNRIPVTAAVLSTGSELMLGQTVDTNSAWISAFLSERGVSVTRHVSVGDDLPRLTEAVADCFARCEITLVTGGLGPTEDDLTRLAVSRTLNSPLVFQPLLAEEIDRHMTTRGYKFSDNNLRQAWLPGGSRLVPNPWGTAPAFAVENDERLMVFMPGVPQEMKNIMRSWVAPNLERKYSSRLRVRLTTVLRVAGLGESRVDEIIGHIIRDSSNPTLGLLAGPYETRILVTAEGKTREETERIGAPTIEEIISLIGDNYVGRDGETMVSTSVKMLQDRGLKLGLIDCVTGGQAAEPFLKILPKENLAAALVVSPAQIKTEVERLFVQFDADLVGVVSRPELTESSAASTDEDEEFSVRSQLFQKIEGEAKDETEVAKEIAVADRLVGRASVQAKTRAGALMTWQLWTFLKSLSPKG